MKSGEMNNLIAPKIESSRPRVSRENEGYKGIAEITNITEKTPTFRDKLIKASEGILFTPQAEIQRIQAEKNLVHSDKLREEREEKRLEKIDSILQELSEKNEQPKFEAGDIKDGKIALKELIDESAFEEAQYNPFISRIRTSNNILNVLNPGKESSDKEIATAMNVIDVNVIDNIREASFGIEYTISVGENVLPKVDDTLPILQSLIDELRKIQGRSLNERIEAIQSHMKSAVQNEDGTINTKKSKSYLTAFNTLERYPEETKKALKSKDGSYNALRVMDKVIRKEAGISPERDDLLKKVAENKALEDLNILALPKGQDVRVDVFYEQLSKNLGVDEENLRSLIGKFPKEVLLTSYANLHYQDELEKLKEKKGLNKLYKVYASAAGVFSGVLATTGTAAAAEKTVKEDPSNIWKLGAFFGVHAVAWVGLRAWGGKSGFRGGWHTLRGAGRIIGNPRNIPDFLRDRYTSPSKNPDTSYNIDELKDLRSEQARMQEWNSRFSYEIQRLAVEYNKGAPKYARDNAGNLYLKDQTGNRYTRDRRGNVRDENGNLIQAQNVIDSLIPEIELDNNGVEIYEGNTQAIRDEIERLNALIEYVQQNGEISYAMWQQTRARLPELQKRNPGRYRLEEAITRLGRKGVKPGDLGSYRLFRSRLSGVLHPENDTDAKKIKYLNDINIYQSQNDRPDLNKNTINQQIEQAQKTRGSARNTDILAVLEGSAILGFERLFWGGIVDTTLLSRDPWDERFKNVPFVKKIAVVSGQGIIGIIGATQLFDYLVGTFSSQHYRVNLFDSYAWGRGVVHDAMPYLYETPLAFISGPHPLLLDAFQIATDKIQSGINPQPSAIPPTPGSSAPGGSGGNTGTNNNGNPIPTVDGKPGKMTK